MKSWWEKLSVKQRQLLQYGGVILALLALVVMFMRPDETYKLRAQKPSKTLLTDANARELSLDQMQAEMRRMQQENNTISKEMQSMRKQNSELIGKQGVNRDDLDKLRLELSSQIAQQLQSLQASQTPLLTHQDDPLAATRPKSSDPFDATGARPPQNLKPALGAGPRQVASPGQVQAPTPAGQGPGVGGDSGRIRVIGPAADQSKADPAVDSKVASTSKAKAENPLAEDRRMFIPAGSIVRGVLLTGMDAPTAKNARSDPYPALIRITDDAILPNFYIADIRECFMIAAGYGDLSSERLMLRSETLSCVTNTGGVIEVPIKAYATGDDGKTGLRGRLVNKQASLIAKAMLAGALDGFSAVFQRAAVPTINTVASPNTQFQSLISADSAQSGAAAGAGRALERLAQYYMDLADSIHPVIEVDAGRNVDMVLSVGVNIAPLDS